MIHLRTLAIVALFTLLVTGSASAQDTLRTVTVSGEGIIVALPDRAVVRFGVVTKHVNPEEAHRLNQAASAEAMNAVRALGIEEQKIRLETLQIDVDRRYNQDTRTYDEVGYVATREVTVTVDNLDLLPSVVSEIVARGANRLTGISYDLKDRESVRRQALKQAAANAHAKAELLAETLGATLGHVITINEQGVYMPVPQVMMTRALSAEAMADAAPNPAAFAAGEMEIRANVNLVFRLR